MTSPILSVVIPVYQAEDTLTKCVNSVLSQTLTSFELILVDDGSADSSLSLCHHLASIDSRIRVLHQENQGPNPARATGVAAATGTWLTFVDADDTLPSHALATLLAAADNSTDIVLGNGYTLRNEHRTTIPMSDFRHLAVRGEGAIGLPWGSLYRRAILTAAMFAVPSDIRMGEDYIFWLRLVFSTTLPVRIVYDQVYLKGDDHACSTFRWTATYAARIHELRVAAIPLKQRDQYLYDTVLDRLDNLFTIAVASSKKEWINSNFYQGIQADLQSINRSLPLKKRLFLALPSRSLRKLYSICSDFIALFRKHLSA